MLKLTFGRQALYMARDYPAIPAWWCHSWQPCNPTSGDRIQR